ncbi:MAG: acetyl-CoA C-acyltransferase [Oceanospirillales bacterium]|nr:acetyl-CoA C-acyltransferase [Oceanospirillales bacterium]
MTVKPSEPVVIDAVRSTITRCGDGGFRNLDAQQLSAAVIDGLLARNPGVDLDGVDELIWGCADTTCAQEGNLARWALLLSRLPHSVPAQTVNRLGASSMTAVHLAAQAVLAGSGECYIAGGVEHSGGVMPPMASGAPRLARITATAALSRDKVGELLAHTHAIDRRMQDEYALRSHRLAQRAVVDGTFEQQLVTVPGLDPHGYLRPLKVDELIVPDLSLDRLAGYEPSVRRSGGSVTEANTAAAADGASALLIMSAGRASALGLKPRARIRAVAVTACDPAVGALAAVTALEKLLDQSGLSLADIDLFDIHEECAAQTLAILKELELLDRLDDSVNLNGGAIALGDPSGCSGARICTTLLHLMAAREAALGAAVITAGLGQGVATLFERLDR